MGKWAGLSLHQHGGAWLLHLTGARRWFFYPPQYQANISDPLMSRIFSTRPAGWVQSGLYNNLSILPSTKDTSNEKKLGASPPARPIECTARPGDVIWFPKGWWHATLT